MYLKLEFFFRPCLYNYIKCGRCGLNYYQNKCIYFVSLSLFFFIFITSGLSIRALHLLQLNMPDEPWMRTLKNFKFKIDVECFLWKVVHVPTLLWKKIIKKPKQMRIISATNRKPPIMVKSYCHKKKGCKETLISW